MPRYVLYNLLIKWKYSHPLVAKYHGSRSRDRALGGGGVWMSEFVNALTGKNVSLATCDENKVSRYVRERITPINYQLNFTKQSKFTYISPIDRICTFWLHHFFETHIQAYLAVCRRLYTASHWQPWQNDQVQLWFSNYMLASYNRPGLQSNRLATAVHACSWYCPRKPQRSSATGNMHLVDSVD